MISCVQNTWSDPGCVNEVGNITSLLTSYFTSVCKSGTLLSKLNGVGHHVLNVSTHCIIVLALTEERVQVTGNNIAIGPFYADSECHPNSTHCSPSAGWYTWLYIAYSNRESAGMGECTQVAQQFQMPLHLNASHGIHPTIEHPSSCSVQLMGARGSMSRYAPTGIGKSLHATSQMEQLPAEGPRGKDQPPKQLQWALGTGVMPKLGFNEQEGIWSSDGLVGRRMKLQSPRGMEACACPAQVSLLSGFHGYSLLRLQVHRRCLRPA